MRPLTVSVRIRIRTIHRSVRVIETYRRRLDMRRKFAQLLMMSPVHLTRQCQTQADQGETYTADLIYRELPVPNERSVN